MPDEQVIRKTFEQVDIEAIGSARCVITPILRHDVQVSNREGCSNIQETMDYKAVDYRAQ